MYNYNNWSISIINMDFPDDKYRYNNTYQLDNSTLNTAIKDVDDDDESLLTISQHQQDKSESIHDEPLGTIHITITGSKILEERFRNPYNLNYAVIHNEEIKTQNITEIDEEKQEKSSFLDVSQSVANEDK